MPTKIQNDVFTPIEIIINCIKAAIIELNLGQIHEYHLFLRSRFMLFENKIKR
jgi:hypothetical protein